VCEAFNPRFELDERAKVRDPCDASFFYLPNRVRALNRRPGVVTELLQAEGGELLQALQHLVTQAYGRKLPEGQRLFCDVEGFRATREAELRAMANHAAERVRTTGVPFVFGEMNSNERRIIHLTLAEQEDIFTESIGDGAARKLRVVKKPSA